MAAQPSLIRTSQGLVRPKVGGGPAKTGEGGAAPGGALRGAEMSSR